MTPDEQGGFSVLTKPESCDNKVVMITTVFKGLKLFSTLTVTVLLFTLTLSYLSWVE